MFHLCSTGGFLQSVVFGYGGLRLDDGMLVVNPPPLPQNATALKLVSFHYMGSSINLTITAASMTVEVIAQEPGGVSLQWVVASNAPVPLPIGQSVTVDVASSFIEPVPMNAT